MVSCPNVLQDPTDGCIKRPRRSCPAPPALALSLRRLFVVQIEEDDSLWCKPNRHVRVVNVIGNIPSVPESWLLRIVTTICSQGETVTSTECHGHHAPGRPSTISMTR
ncbi:Hypothetical protein NTJ_02684 [Nesidiocoris tenuis]|uniref:Uncharacterized protein n=1 Tax=Nesidiocoris tenuis TaxID=355587 RepID=A0ABN7AC68_9HEMI|nr:Hypothetical protein NTJ_02684 [Nesidiocoris tenuis]